MSSPLPLINQICIVTGATRGIGKGIAIGLGEAGATVYITGRTAVSPPSSTPGSATAFDAGCSLAATKAAVEAAGGKCIAVQLDHADDDAVEKFFERVDSETGGRIDLLVNNVYAGVSAIFDSVKTPFWEKPVGHWDTIANVGLRSHYVATVHAARIMAKRADSTGSPPIVANISSWGGFLSIFDVAYGAGKAAVDRLAADAAAPLRKIGVASVSMYPGLVKTEFMDANVMDSFGTSARYTAESPVYTGRVLAAMLADRERVLKRDSGKVVVVAEAAKRYGIVDVDGLYKVSFRSLRGVAVQALAGKGKKWTAWAQRLVPDVCVPWIIMVWAALVSPRM